jgi:hypothetical protein
MLLLLRVTLVEAIDTPVNLGKAIFSGKEWVAACACINPNLI